MFNVKIHQLTKQIVARFNSSLENVAYLIVTFGFFTKTNNRYTFLTNSTEKQLAVLIAGQCSSYCSFSNSERSIHSGEMKFGM